MTKDKGSSMQNDYYSPYQYGPTPEQQLRTRGLLKMVLIAITSLAIAAGVLLITLQVVDGLIANNPGGDKILIEIDGTQFHFGDSYGEVIREISQQRTIYDYNGIMDNGYTELTDIDNYLGNTIAEGEKNTVLKKSGDDGTPIMFISVGKKGPVNEDYRTKLQDAHTRLIIYPLGEKIAFSIDGRPLQLGVTTSKEYLEAFPEAQERIAEGESKSKSYMHYYKNRYIYTAFDENDKLFGVEMLDFKLY